MKITSFLLRDLAFHKFTNYFMMGLAVSKRVLKASVSITTRCTSSRTGKAEKTDKKSTKWKCKVSTFNQP